jgi:hypothetical protein
MNQEASSMNSESPNRDPVEAWLRQNTVPPLPDGGFSQRVLSALPSRRPAPEAWRSWAVAAGGVAGGLAVVLLRSGGVSGFNSLAASLSSLAGSGADVLFLPGYGLALVFAAAVLILALETDESTNE